MAVTSEAVLCIILVVHVCLLVNVGISLAVRYGLYGTQRFYDLPGDMRVLSLAHHKLFCSRLEVITVTSRSQNLVLHPDGDKSVNVYEVLDTFGNTSNIIHGDKNDINSTDGVGQIDTVGTVLFPSHHFDLYGFLKPPIVDPEKSKKFKYHAKTRLSYFYPHWYQHVNLLPQSKVNMEVLTKRNSGIVLLVLHGRRCYKWWRKLDSVSKDMMTNHRCIEIFEKLTEYVTRISFVAKTTDADHVILLYRPQSSGSYRPGHATVQIHADIEHTTYSIPQYNKPVCKSVSNCTVLTYKYLLLDLPYVTEESTLTPQDGLTVLFKCEPNVLVYFGIFGVIPLLFICLGTWLFCERKHGKLSDLMEGPINGHAPTLSPIRGEFDYMDTSSEEGCAQGEVCPPPRSSRARSAPPLTLTDDEESRLLAA